MPPEYTPAEVQAYKSTKLIIKNDGTAHLIKTVAIYRNFLPQKAQNSKSESK
jgi:hypothetical protein